MKGKKSFTRSEAEKIKSLINRKVRSSKYDQKRIRDEIRAIGFYFSDFSNEKGYKVTDFEKLIISQQIKIVDSAYSQEVLIKNSESESNRLALLNNSKTVIKKSEIVETVNISEVELKLITEVEYHIASGVDSKMPNDKTGLYSIRLSPNSILPEKYQKILTKREHKIIYIGKAEGQSLFDRLQQELRATGPGTFFRSIGAVLGFLPPYGSLINKKNQNNYKFSKEDKLKIVEWINSNLEIGWINYSGNFSVEKQLIQMYCPLLNDAHNPMALNELREDKNKCREVARGN